MIVAFTVLIDVSEEKCGTQTKAIKVGVADNEISEIMFMEKKIITEKGKPHKIQVLL